MKIIYRILIFLMLANAALFGQESSFYDAPFGGGGGYVGGWIVPKLDGVNAQLKGFGVPDMPASGFYTSGGAGFIYLGIVPNLRIGGIGFGGSRSSSISKTINGPGPVPLYVKESREAVLSLSGGGLTVEYTLPYVKNIGISVGALLGRGSLNIQLYKNLGNYDWQYFWLEARSANSSTFSSTLKNSYWIFTPTLNFDIPTYRLIDFRIGLGYQLTFGSKWTYDNNKDILNAPSDISGNCFYIQAGVFVGLFSF